MVVSKFVGESCDFRVIITGKMEGGVLPYRSPPRVEAPTQDDIWFTAAGIRKRRIFYNTAFSAEEEGWVEEVRRALRERGEEGGEDDGCLLCYYYSTNCQLEECVEKVLFRRKWFVDPQVQQVSSRAEELLREGWVYHYEYSREGRPFVVMQLGAVDLGRYTLQHYYQAINRVQNHVIARKFTPGRVEAYDYILDIQERLLTLPVGTLRDIIHTISYTYSMKMRRMWVVNANTLVKWGYEGLKGLMSEETTRKIAVLTPAQLREGALLEFIDGSVLEQKYGGELPALNYPALYRQELLGLPAVGAPDEQTEYLSVEDNEDFFAQHESRACCGPDNCAIY